MTAAASAYPVDPMPPAIARLLLYRIAARLAAAAADLPEINPVSRPTEGSPI